jgi:trehalose 6-phosphate phosphatase
MSLAREGGSVNAELRPVETMLEHASEAAIFFDVDGVLAPIRLRPEQASVPDEVRALLAALLPRFALVAVVSGRAAEDARRLVGIPGLNVVGNHGLEVVLDGRPEMLGSNEHVGHVEAAVQRLRGDVALAAVGVRIEDKGGSVALHTRGVADEEAAWDAAVAAAQQAATAHGLVMLPGRRVVDLRPPGVNKGTAVRSLIERLGLRAAFYAGDDRTDLDAFRALRAMRDDGLHSVNVAVVSAEGPPELAELADVAIDIRQVPGLLRLLGGTASSDLYPREGG